MSSVSRIARGIRAGRRGRKAATAVILAGMGLLAAGLTPSAQAQTQEAHWWEQIPGFGTPGASSSGRRDTEGRARDQAAAPLNDLRTDSTPLRSDAMLAAYDDAIARYQQIAASGGWGTIPGTRMIRPGDDDERVPYVRRRLIMGGDLRSQQGYQSFGFDGELEVAVRRFQERHGLRVSGRVDQPTLQAMNIPVQARMAQLRLNQQRVRDLIGQRMEDKYVLVNVPAFQLEAVERHNVEQRHRVIAGKPERQTPSVRATIRALNFFPYWRVPDSVATLDLMPRLAKEPDYLAKEQIRVLTGSFNGPEINPTNIDWRQADATRIKFRQDPGPQNALGLVRLDMPNEHGVYMHDTPMKKLFEQRARGFSAGCVRVQNVFDLAAWIARDEPGGWTRERIDDVLAGGQAVDVTLTRPIPVYFAYVTAWAEPNGRVEFRPDIYGRDGLRELSSDRERDPDAPMPTQTLTP
ncbi:MAG: L,D-transpeptidase family protein [Sphingomonadales bacterium]|nr:L,D-transpeptidase family protein [Sphingomonadales bacterium]